MKKRTGNGTATRQWIYILWNIPFIWIVKIGISGDAKKRRKQIDDSAPGVDLCVFKIKIRWAYQVEQFTHRLCSFLRVGFWGSGKTERFWFPAAVVAFLFSVLVFVIEWSLYIALFFGIAYLLSQ